MLLAFRWIIHALLPPISFHSDSSSIRLKFPQITRIIQLDAQSKPMYLRTLLYALRREVGLNPMTKASKCFEIENDSSASTRASITSGPGEDEGEEVNVKVPDESLYFYLSSKDSSSLTSKVLDMYAAYVDEGEVRVCVCEV